MYKKIIFLAVVLLLVIAPVDIFPAVAEGLVKCGTDKPCGFEDLLILINTVVNFVMIQLMIPLAALLFAYAGGMLMFSGGEVSKRQQAKKIFTNVALGLIIAAASWLIVNTVLTIMGYNGAWIGFKDVVQ
ncbi:MAG TPA: hypothetical protein VFQ59_00480 [Candidatus Paceibacterota bacterium]|nr:hypothetical protein [Candidatus Paceibacterota bacterium]